MEYTEIYYAIRIDTGTTETNLNIGLDTGILTLITERYAETTNAINTIDSEVYTTKKYSNFLEKKGIGSTSQSIDIVNGGDYSNLNNFTFSVVNTASNGSTFLAELDTLTEAYLIGSKIQYFICTPVSSGNDEWLPKWTGVIDNIMPNGLSVKFSCIDRFMKDYLMLPQTVIVNSEDDDGIIPVVFGDFKYTKPLYRLNNFSVMETLPVYSLLRVKPNINETFTDAIFNRTASLPPEGSTRDGGSIEDATRINGFSWVVPVKKTFDDNTIFIGKYIQFNNNFVTSQEDMINGISYKIARVFEGGLSNEFTFFVINEVPEFLTDTTQFFGEGILNNDSGEIIGSDVVYMKVIDIDIDFIISENEINSIEDANLRNDMIYDRNGVAVLIRGNIDYFSSKIDISETSLTTSPSTFRMGLVKYKGDTINNFSALLPVSGFWYNNKEDTVDGGLGGGATGKPKLKFSLNSNRDEFDILMPGANSAYYGWIIDGLSENYYVPDFSKYIYTKCNIHTEYTNDVNVDNYDNLYSMLNFQPEKILVAQEGDPLTPVKKFSLGTSQGIFDYDWIWNTGNDAVVNYQIEIRTTIPSSEPETYFSPNFNDIDDMLPLPSKQTSISNTFTYPYDDYLDDPTYAIGKEYIGVTRLCINSIPDSLLENEIYTYTESDPVELVDHTWTNQYLYTLPKIMNVPLEITGINNDYWNVEGITYDSLNSLEFSHDLPQITKGENTFNYITTITPFLSNGVSTWDTLLLKIIALGLKKEVNIKEDIYIKVKGEKLSNDLNYIVVTGSDANYYDGIYEYDSVTGGYINDSIGINGAGIISTTVLNTIVWQLSDLDTLTAQYNIVGVSETIPPNGLWNPIGANIERPLIEANGIETNNVYNALRHLINKYSNVVNVDFHNLSSTRLNWNLGRQISDRKNTFDYIRELCKQSFVAGWVDGAGTLNFNAFRESLADDDTLVLHDSSIIIEGSIKNFKRTPISKVYNEINVQYDYNPITQKYNYNYAINKVDEPSFPLSTEDWSDYVQGIDNYATAKGVWERAHESYLETRIANLTPSDRSDLNWANDLGNFNDSENYDKTDEYAYKYFILTTDWNTRQKNTVTYSLPITSDTKLLELMQRVRFNDPLYTATSNFTGWITDLKIDALNDKITVTLTMELNKTRWPITECNEIVERSTNIDTIIEDSANTDEIIEGC